MGCTARITDVTRRYPDGRMDIMTRGEERFLIQKLIDERPFLQAHISLLEDTDTSIPDHPQDLLTRFRQKIKMLSTLVDVTDHAHLTGQFDPHKLSYVIPSVPGFTSIERQHFLEMTATSERLEKGLRALSKLIQREQLNREFARIIGRNGNPANAEAGLRSLNLLE